MEKDFGVHSLVQPLNGGKEHGKQKHKTMNEKTIHQMSDWILCFHNSCDFSYEK